MNVYEIVTAKIMQKLEEGTVPWRRPWTGAGVAVNWRTQTPYRGINAFLLDPGEYATFKQIQAAGGHVKAGEKGHLVVFWKWLDSTNQETGESERVPLLRYYTVFHVLTQAQGLESRRHLETWDHSPIEKAEAVLQAVTNGPRIQYAGGRAFYRPNADLVSVPPLTDYAHPEEFYSTLFHELIHSTGHQKRLARPGIMEVHQFGDEIYSKEELIAELGASMLCATCHLDSHTLDNSAAYVNGWLRALQGDQRLVITAAAQAQKAADCLLGTQTNEQQDDMTAAS